MKLTLYAILLLFLGGCSAGLQQWQSSYYVTDLRFAEYSQNGFLFTPEGYNESYDSMGLVELSYVPQVRRYTGGASQPLIAGANVIATSSGEYYYVQPDMNEIISRLHDIAKDMGADAIIRLKLEPVQIDNNGYAINTIRATGFAIKRH